MTYQNFPQTDIARELIAEFTDALKIQVCLHSRQHKRYWIWKAGIDSVHKLGLVGT